jgi:hypothetical protein
VVEGVEERGGVLAEVVGEIWNKDEAGTLKLYRDWAYRG